MTKTMLQIGILAFFVSAVFFGSGGVGLMDMITRAFIVFIAVVAGQAVLLMAAASMKNKKVVMREESHTPPSDEPGSPGQRTQTAS